MTDCGPGGFTFHRRTKVMLTSGLNLKSEAIKQQQEPLEKPKKSPEPVNANVGLMSELDPSQDEVRKQGE